jgi:hypothetical protein
MSDTTTLRSDDRDLITAIAELNNALSDALAHLPAAQVDALQHTIQRYSLALINRITVISGSDQMDVARLRAEVSELRADVRALQERFVGDSGEPYQ